MNDLNWNLDETDKIQDVFRQVDRDGDGEINEEEFLRIMKKTSLY